MAINKFPGSSRPPKKSSVSGIPRNAAKAAEKAKNQSGPQRVQASANPSRDAIKVMGYSVQQRSRLRNLIALGATGAFLCTVAVLGWLTDGEIFTNTWQAVVRFEAPGAAPRDIALNCANPKNKNTPYCDKRDQQLRSTWNGITRNNDGKAAAFTLHGKSN